MNGRRFLQSILLLLFFTTGWSAHAQQQIKRTNTSKAIPYLEHLPQGYSDAENAGQQYPLLLFLHGTGEQGDGSDAMVWDVALNGPPKHIKNGHDMTFTVDEKAHSFIVISPQLIYGNGNWRDEYIDEVLQHVLDTYRIDRSRIYLTGLSLGGGGTWRFGGAHADLFAAIAPVCGAQSVMYNLARNIEENHLPVWAFHGDADGVVPISSTQKWIEVINSYGANPAAKMTTYPGVGHNSWSRAYNTSHTYHQPNLYEWLLQHTKGNAAPSAPAPAPPAPNQAPVVDAGKNSTLQLPANTTTLNGSATDDGNVTSYLWTQTAGPNQALISASTNATTKIENLIKGTYTFKLTATDNQQTSASDEVTVTVEAAASSCGCTYTIPAGQHITDGNTLGIQPGDVICLDAGINYQNLKLQNIHGTESNPVTIKNCGGKVTINTGATFVMKINGSKHFRITGSGDSGHAYGIELKGAKSLGISLGMKSTNFEVDHLEIHDIGFAGIMAKTDPSCGGANDRSQFTMEDIKIHDNYVYDTDGEGLYVGNSFYARGRNLDCGTLMPHAIIGAKIYNNIVRHTGWDGIQVGTAIEGCEVYNNVVEDYGWKENGTHGNGIQLGEGTGGKCYNNTIKNGFGNGIIVLGWGDNVIFNNLIINPGSFGTFIDSRPPATPGDGFKFVNNTIINAASDGVRIYAKDDNLQNQVKNNIIIAQGEYVKLLHNGITNTTVSNNFTARNTDAVGFVNAAEGDFHLNSASSCVNKGADLTAYGVSFDIEKVARPQQGAFDIGACELVGEATPEPTPSPTPVGSEGNGLHYTYYEGSWNVLPDFANMTAQKTGTADNFTLSPRTQDEQFGFVYDGFIEITTAGTYTFHTQSDDGSKLYINGQEVVDNDGLHGAQERSGSITLDQGRHAIQVQFFEKSGGEVLTVSYAGPGIEKTIIPESVLFLEDDATSENPAPTPAPEPAPAPSPAPAPAPSPAPEPTPSPSTEGNIRYSYYEGIWNTLPDFATLTPVATGQVHNFDLDIKKRNYEFGVVFEGYIDIPVSGEYTFALNADDGSKLYIGGFEESNLVVDNDGPHAATFQTGTVMLNAGVHPIIVTFYERWGQELLEVYWENTAHGVTNRTLIPDEALVKAGEVNTPEVPTVEIPEISPSVYVNFSNSQSVAPAPWNNFIGTEAGTQLSNLQDAEGNNTGLSVSLIDRWGGNKSQTVSGTALYPKEVAASYHWDASPNQKRIKVAGLEAGQPYTITFFPYRAGSGNRTTTYTIGGKTVELNAANNLTDTVFISDVAPNKQGEIVITANRTADASFAYLNAMVIQKTSTTQARKSSHAKKTAATDMEGSLNSPAKVYPNPVVNRALITLSLAQDQSDVYVQVQNLMGITMYTSPVYSKRQGTATIALNNLSKLGSGTYLVSVYYGGQRQQMMRVIKD